MMDDLSRPAQATASSQTTYPRSCIPCNRRKLRCDRKFPCGRCVKGGEQCVFPGPKRAPRQLKRPPIAEVLAQLRQLEQEVQLLRAQAQQPVEAGSASSSSPLGHSQEEATGPLEPGQREGRLVVKEGKSRYVGDAPSAVLGDKVGSLSSFDTCSSPNKSPDGCVRDYSRSENYMISVMHHPPRMNWRPRRHPACTSPVASGATGAITVYGTPICSQIRCSAYGKSIKTMWHRYSPFYMYLPWRSWYVKNPRTSIRTLPAKHSFSPSASLPS